MSVLDAPTAVLEVEATRVEIDAYFEQRAADVDAGQASIREGLAVLGDRGLASANIAESVALVSQVARSDMSTAFSAWAHRMVIDYLSVSSNGSTAPDAIPALSRADTIGATALAAGTAAVLAGAPLPVSYRDDGDELILDGRIAWASNLIAPFVVVSAAVYADDPDRAIVVAIDSGTPGLEVAPFPKLLALDATGSTTIKLDGVRVPRTQIVSDDLSSFVHRILARFLLLQGAFCSGLAHRALDEAGAANQGPLSEVLRPHIETLELDVASADTAAAEFAAASIAGEQIPTDRLLRLRLQWSELTTSAVSLELKATGGRGYLASSPTARRFREAAFLPIQAPTEVLLRWLLWRSA